MKGMAQLFLKLFVVWKNLVRFLYLDSIQRSKFSVHGNFQGPSGSMNRQHGDLVILRRRRFSQRKELLAGQQERQSGPDLATRISGNSNHRKLCLSITISDLNFTGRFSLNAKAPTHGSAKAICEFFFGWKVGHINDQGFVVVLVLSDIIGEFDLEQKPSVLMPHHCSDEVGSMRQTRGDVSTSYK